AADHKEHRDQRQHHGDGAMAAEDIAATADGHRQTDNGERDQNEERGLPLVSGELGDHAGELSVLKRTGWADIALCGGRFIAWSSPVPNAARSSAWAAALQMMFPGPIRCAWAREAHSYSRSV